MKTQITLLLLLLPLLAAAQSTISGRVVDETTGQPLAYVNIGIVGAGVGTVSAMDGSFSFRLPQTLEKSKLRLSLLSYESKEFTAGNFLDDLNTQGIVSLKPQTYDLTQVVVVPKYNKTRRIGNEAVRRNLDDGFAGDKLGREGGIIVKLKDKYRPAIVTNFRVHIKRNDYDSIKFRLNFYSVRNNLPDKPLSRESIIISSAIRAGVLEVDLEQYEVIVSDDFAITLEWIEDFKGSDRWNGLRFSMRRFGPRCVFRYASQDAWESYSGLLAPSPCMNVTIGYKD